ncbi:disulfide bond corrector protein DsbC [Maioricimonas rarisocia]|uniref:Disulfide bond corrector protein DsbC n=1 Tax=Maioricimonas rarisocia TaxID=2528026 RepID=A0A517ZAF5_9PLAN|nr:DUF255 domain-containing protein [Maioricimonas rarisocia]QDU39448.1 disulfide bond corrector protein DsbC [Maioricimonas rarisocia]
MSELKTLTRATCLLMLLLLSACSLQGENAFSAEGDGKAAADQSAPPAATAPEKAAHGENRLARESSPYLLLHAHNPVDWYPWGPEAFERARREDKPIFLSIGYSTCFWCHVMERKVFSNEEIAEYMNEHFVCVKVDREERPDVDDLYMLALQVYFQAVGSSQGGGWPLSLFLTPAGEPIAGGTYFPPEDLPGRPGFPSVMQRVHDLWMTRRADIERGATMIAREVRRLSRPGLNLKLVPLSTDLVNASVEAVKGSYDPEHGGFDFNPQAPAGPKFPSPPKLQLVQVRIPQDMSGKLAEMLDHTLDRMAAGGIRDHLGGGFHRYSVDREWQVPHFEKMLYDNAQLAQVYVAAFQRTSRTSYRDIASETFDFVLHDLTDPAGGFYSALDAETDGIEGKYYVWSPEEVTSILGAEDAKVFSAVYGLDQPQVFEHGYVLRQRDALADVADRLQLPVSELQLKLDGMRAKMLAARGQRPQLLRDDKVLTSWNGLMIRALADGGRILREQKYVDAAEKAALFILRQMRDEEGRLYRSWRNGKAHLNAYLDDYAFLVDGLLALHTATKDDKWLNAARRLTDDQIAMYWDEAGHGFFFTADHHEELLARPKNAYDSVLPSGNSVSARNLVRLARLTGEARYRELAEKTLQAFMPKLQETPGGLAYLAVATHDYLAAFGPSDGVGSEGLFAETPADTPTPDDEKTARAERLKPFAVLPEEEAAKHDKVSGSAYLSVARLPAGGKCEVAIVLSVKETWHINANPPQPDYVLPTEVIVSASHGTELAGINYPEGHAFMVEGFDEPLSVYEGKVILRGVLTVPEEAAGQIEELELLVRYQACNDKTCQRPMKMKLTGQIPVAPKGERIRSINQSLFPEKAKP